MGTVLTSLPVGERVGIAFSGGLDTSAAVAWMREKGAVPYTYTADLGQYDEPDLAGVPDRAEAVRRRAGPARRLPRASSSTRAWSPCSAAPSTSPPPARRTSTPPRSAGPSPARCSCGRCRTTASTSGATARTYKGNDIERFYRYGLLVNPNLRIYKPWLDAAFVDELGGRAEMSEWLSSHAASPTATATEKAYSTDANIWGATHEAKLLEQLDDGMDIVEPIMGVAHWDEAVAIAPETVDDRASTRAGRSRSTARSSPIRVELVRRPTRSAGATAWA